MSSELKELAQGHRQKRNLNLGSVAPQLTGLTSTRLPLASAGELALHRGGDTGARPSAGPRRGWHSCTERQTPSAWHGVKGRWGLHRERPCKPSRAAGFHPEPRGSWMDFTQGTAMGFISWEAAVETVDMELRREILGA